MRAPKEVEHLVEKFDRNLKQYKHASYDEANVRVDFVDKFFTILGWDVSNEKGYSEDYREVVREDKVVIQGKPKAPDYSFRIGGVRKFFVEAKKPSVDIKHAASPALQIRRYAYTAKLPLSILTDFEEFSVYKPANSCQPPHGGGETGATLPQEVATERVFLLGYLFFLHKKEKVT